jgi:large subunit ribosomal protein L23
VKKHLVLRRPVVTEKSTARQAGANQYFFEVDTKATKHDIRTAVESLFKVQVTKVCTMNVFGKRKRVGRNVGVTSDWKKAIVTLKEGDRIEILEGK